MTTTKRCPKCEKTKVLTDFQKNQCRCKECRREWYNEHRVTIIGKQKKYQQDNKNTYLTYQRNYSLTHREERKLHSQLSRVKKSHAEGAIKYKLSYPEKVRAVHLVGSAVRDGRLIRPATCESCNEEKFVHGHHEDYLKQLEVNWLCVNCHVELHKKLLLV